VLHPRISTLILIDETVSITGVNVRFVGVSVKVGSKEGVALVLDKVEVIGKDVYVEKTGGRRIIGVAV
jgi:hypothetical protein